jgi:hypothetical protein
MQFEAEEVLNPVTLKMQAGYSRIKRNIKYFQSFLICLPFMLITLFMMVCFLNLHGYTLAEPDGVLYIKWLADLAAPGAILDATSNMNYITVLLQPSITLTFNLTFKYPKRLRIYFREIAIFCTKRENHRTQTSFDKSLILKRFIFEFSDCFLPLFYTAFYKFNLSDTRKDLVRSSLFLN